MLYKSEIIKYINVNRCTENARTRFQRNETQRDLNMFAQNKLNSPNSNPENSGLHAQM